MSVNLEDIIVDLYRKTATELPLDVLNALKQSKEHEKENPYKIFEMIIQNSKIAEEKSIPICQDTGTPIFYIDCGKNFNQETLTKLIQQATIRATDEMLLRPNSVNSLDSSNSGNNIGSFFPLIYFNQKNMEGLKISLLLKGGGSENVGKRYSLPNNDLKALRNLEGVRKCILDAVYQAQGKGCAPGTISACIGGSKDIISFLSKKQLCEKLNRTNENPELDKLEKRILNEANSLGIGPMGLGGKTTLLDVKICTTHRHPASYFVEVAYSCWALRRNTIHISDDGAVKYE